MCRCLAHSRRNCIWALALSDSGLRSPRVSPRSRYLGGGGGGEGSRALEGRAQFRNYFIAQFGRLEHFHSRAQAHHHEAGFFFVFKRNLQTNPSVRISLLGRRRNYPADTDPVGCPRLQTKRRFVAAPAL